MIARAPEPSPRCLSDAEPGDLVRVRLIVFELVRSRCWDLPLREGDMLQYIDGGGRDITVARLDGTRVLVPYECARFVGIDLVAGEGGTGGGRGRGPRRWRTPAPSR